MAPKSLVYANALAIDPHILALVAAFSQDEDRPCPGTEHIYVTPPLTPPPYHQAPLLLGAPLQRIISISDSDDEAPQVPERRAGKKPERYLNDVRTGVGSPRKISLGDSKLDDLMARVSLDSKDNGKSSRPRRCAVLIVAVVRVNSATAGPSRSRRVPSPPPSPVPPSAPSTPPRTNPKTYEVASPSRTGNVPTWPLAGHLTQGVPGAHVHRGADDIRVRGGPRSPRKPRSVAYVVFQGLEIGVFNDWYVTYYLTLISLTLVLQA